MAGQVAGRERQQGAVFPESEIQEMTHRLLQIVRQLSEELHPGEALRGDSVTLDTVLDKELGFDSLGRMELLARLEREFGVQLSERRVIQVETPRELLAAILSLERGGQAAAPEVAAPLAEPEDALSAASANTLMEVLEWQAHHHGQRIHIHLYGEQGETEQISYAALLAGARRVAAGLLAKGIEPGQTVALMLPTSRDYFFSFFGALLAGAVPVPIYPPTRPSQLEEHVRRHAAILSNAQTALLITVEEALPVSQLLKSMLTRLRTVVTLRLLLEAGGECPPCSAHAGDIAFIQYTSGSTGNPKGVVLTHENLLANVRSMGKTVAAGAGDVFVSWLPLYHDMGLIGAWLGSLYFAMPLVIMSPLSFLARPHAWLWAIHRHRGTLSAAPNFAYALCLKKIRDDDIEGLDLSSWRLAFNGAEPVSARTLREFSRRFERYGFDPKAMSPVYGLAENAVGLAFPPLGRGPLIDRVQRASMMASGRAVPAVDSDRSALEFVACGRPLQGHQIRVVDAAGRELPDRREGRLQFRGPSSTRGYYHNPEATRVLFDGDWLDTGDLAYIADADVYMTSRVKDIIIRAGRNIYPYEVEEAVGAIAGVRKGCVALFGCEDPDTGTERIIVLAETNVTDPAAKAKLQKDVQAVATDLLGTPPDEAVLAPPHSVLKTSSGKIRRAASRENYQRGDIGKGPRALWRQWVRLRLAGLRPGIRRARQALLAMGFAVWAWLLFLLLSPPVWLLVVTLPRLRQRWAVMGLGSRLLARAVGVPLQVNGLDFLSRLQGAVLVANHASYLDGMLLVACLSQPCHFVAKSELQGRFVSRLFLRRIGSEFVDRIDKTRGLEDARRLAAMVRAGETLMFFPEGTFQRTPGLLPFHMGAFIAAAQAGVPVVPIGIRGSRSILRAGSWFPRRAVLGVEIGTPIPPQGRDWRHAIALRDQARERVARLSGEPLSA